MVEFPLMDMNSTFVNWGKGGSFRPGESVHHIIPKRADFFVLCTDDLLNNKWNDFREGVKNLIFSPLLELLT